MGEQLYYLLPHGFLMEQSATAGRTFDREGKGGNNKTPKAATLR
jgi:hypothetical protein